MKLRSKKINLSTRLSPQNQSHIRKFFENAKSEQIFKKYGIVTLSYKLEVLLSIP